MTGRYVTPTLTVDPEIEASPAPEDAAAEILANREADVVVRTDEEARSVLRIVGLDDEHIERQINWGKYGTPIAP